MELTEDVAGFLAGTIKADGVVVTYQWLSSKANSRQLRRALARCLYLAAADEIHHSGQGQPWARAI